MLEPARPRAGRGIARPQRPGGRDVFQVFKDLRGIENLDRAMHQHRHLLLRVDAQDFRMLRAVTDLRVVRHHDQIEVELLLARRDLHLGAEHAERPRIDREAFRHFLPMALSNEAFACDYSWAAFPQAYTLASN